MELIDEKVIQVNAFTYRLKRWYKGWVRIPGGKFIMGYTGPETEVEVDIIRTLRHFRVIEEEPASKQN